MTCNISQSYTYNSDYTYTCTYTYTYIYRTHLSDGRGDGKDDQVLSEGLEALASISNTYMSITLPLGKPLQHAR